MNFDYAIHSGFIIHWTGKDIDCLYDPNWNKNSSGKSLTSKDATNAYIERLENILKYGLWMTKELRDEDRESVLSFNGRTISIPPIARTCFTELKLSESRRHAKEYGRLGIGVKRPFIFDRFGRPLVYYHEKRIKFDKFIETCANNLKDDNHNKYLLNYLKPMNSKDKPQTFDWYAESEWRIIFCEYLSFSKDLLHSKYIIDPNDEKNKKEHDYFKSLCNIEKSKLKYLIPLDGWLAMIIYPSLEVKNKAQQAYSNGIKDEIIKIKSRNDRGNIVEGGNWPIELDLDACRNF